MALIKQRRAWVIALFVESQTYSVIPTTWVFQLTDDFGKITIFCKWPPGLDQDVTSETIKNTTVPTDDWSSYKIRMLDNGKEYYNFSKAWHKKIDYVKSATESEDGPTSSKKSKVNFIPDSESEIEG
ncbi:PREDICTED: uncharacterized protein LOC107172522, partial [Diuraphis noxia]|uniref:uncharacterized protein LOC107172522 n=1 Tax=Diuraphis noxia TaxID=143948 RepID=UPI000763929B